MGGYSEKCPWCDKWFIKPGISDHVQGKHPAMIETFRSMRRAYPNRLINQPIPATGVVANQGDIMAKSTKDDTITLAKTSVEVGDAAVAAAIENEPARTFTDDELEGIRSDARKRATEDQENIDNDKLQSFLIATDDALTSLLQVLYQRKLINWTDVKHITGA